MDDISFERAPLLELVAELRWDPPQVQHRRSRARVAQLALALGREVEEFFQHFGNQIANKAGIDSRGKDRSQWLSCFAASATMAIS